MMLCGAGSKKETVRESTTMTAATMKMEMLMSMLTGAQRRRCWELDVGMENTADRKAAGLEAFRKQELTANGLGPNNRVSAQTK